MCFGRARVRGCVGMGGVETRSPPEAALARHSTVVAGLAKDVLRANDRVLFIHTGGALGAYAQADKLLPLVRPMHHAWRASKL